MSRDLKKGPGGYYTREQWVLSGVVPGKLQGSYAFWLRPLWDFGPDPEMTGGFSSRASATEARQRARMHFVEQIRKEVRGKLSSMQDFEYHGIHVKFVRDEANANIRQLQIWRDGMDPVTLESEFGQDWPEGHFIQAAEDKMMEVAAQEPDGDSEHPAFVGEIRALWGTPLTDEEAKRLVQILGPQQCQTLILALQHLNQDVERIESESQETVNA